MANAVSAVCSQVGTQCAFVRVSVRTCLRVRKIAATAISAGTSRRGRIRTALILDTRSLCVGRLRKVCDPAIGKLGIVPRDFPFRVPFDKSGLLRIRNIRRRDHREDARRVMRRRNAYI